MKKFFDDEDDIYADVLKDFDLLALILPSAKELRKVEKEIKSTHREDYEELTGTAEE